MKFKYMEKFKNGERIQCWIGKKKKINIEVYLSGNKYYFLAERKEDGFRFNSLWKSSPDEIYQRLLNDLPDMKFDSVEKTLEFIEMWIDEKVPSLAL